MSVTLTKIRVSKNGLVLYKAGRQRADGNVYIDSKCFEGEAPETLTVDGVGFKAAAPKPERKAKAQNAETTTEQTATV